MTIAHLLILLAFVCLGSAGIASIQDGLATVFRHLRATMATQRGKTTHPLRSMKIV